MDKLTIYKVQQLSHWMDDPSGELEKIDMSLDEVD